jgi:lysophospholipase L1-like esterase
LTEYEGPHILLFVRGKRWVRILVANGLAAGLVLLLLEVAVRWYTASHLLADIEMSRYALELKIASPNPRLGHLHRPGASAHLMGVEVALSSDGLRDREYSKEAPAGKRRLIFLGDSLTLGWGVPQAETFADRLEQQLPDTEILNFGVGNYNTEQQVQLLLDRGFGLAPDEVVMFWFINDAEPTPQRSAWVGLGRSRALTLLWSCLQRVAWRWQGRSYLDYYQGLYAADAAGWQREQEAFALLQGSCADRGIGLKVVLLPELHELRPYPFDDVHQQVRSALEEHGVPVLDLRAALADSGEDPAALWVAPDDAHPNAQGHQLIAKACLEFLAKP